jgi:hypothetical protein
VERAARGLEELAQVPVLEEPAPVLAAERVVQRERGAPAWARRAPQAQRVADLTRAPPQGLAKVVPRLFVLGEATIQPGADISPTGLKRSGRVLARQLHPMTHGAPLFSSGDSVRLGVDCDQVCPRPDCLTIDG